MEEQYIKERLPLPWFFVLLFLCWIGFIPMILESQGKKLPVALSLLQIVMLLGPIAVALFASYVNGGRIAVKNLLKGFLRWRVHIGWYILAIVAAPIIYAVTLWACHSLGLTTRAMPEGSQILVTFLMSMGVHLILNTEEIAWRGYALPRMRARFGLLWATIFLGVLWAVIHLPLFWMKGGHPAGYSFVGFAVRLLMMNFLFSAAFYGSGKSLLIVHLLHQSLNAGIEAIPVYPRATQSEIPMTIATVALSIIGIILFYRFQRESDSSDSQTNTDSPTTF